MEDLEAFDRLVVASSEGGTGSNDGDGRSMCAPTPEGKRSTANGTKGPNSGTKRRRKSDFYSTPPCSSDQFDATSDPSDEDVSCLGCFRGSVTGKSWYDPSQPLEWNSGGRGSWCKDCYNTWRTVYQPTHTLTLFTTWLQDENNFQRWESTLFSYVSLVYEEFPKITSEMIQQRVQLLEFIGARLGHSTQSLVVVPCEDLLGDRPPVPLPSRLSPNDLVTIKSRTGDRLGFRLPCVIARGEQTVPRPCIPEFGSTFGRRHWLSTSSAADKEFLEKHFGVPQDTTTTTTNDDTRDDNGAGSTRSLSIVPWKANDTPTRPELARLLVKVEVLQKVTRQLLEAWVSDQWEAVKESSFTRIVADWTALSSDVSDEADKKLMGCVGSWLQGVTNLKGFIKKYRTYSKSKLKINKVSELCQCMSAASQFVEHVAGLKLGASFRVLMLKAVFMEKFMEDQNITAAIDSVIRQGLVEVFNGAGARSATSVCPDMWLQGLILHAAAEVLVHMKGALGRAAVLSDLLQLVRALRAQEGLWVKLPELQLDISAITTLLRSCDETDSSDMSATDLNKAIRRMEMPHLVNFRNMANASDGWKTVLATASNQIQLSAKDSLADQKLERAREILQDDRLPALECSTDPEVSPKITNFTLVTDMSWVHNLAESLDLFIEACGMFSNLRAEQQTPVINDWCGDVARSISFIDAALCCWMCAALDEGKVGDMSAECSAEGGTFKWPSGASYRTFAVAIRKFTVDEQPLCDFLTNCLSSIDALSPRIKSNIDIEHMRKLFKDRACVNSELRALVTDWCVALVDFGEAPCTSKALIDEWHAKKMANSSDPTTLAKAVKILRLSERLFELQFEMGDLGDHAEITLDLGDGSGGKVVTSASGAASLPRNVSELLLVGQIRSLMVASVQAVVDSFAESLCLDGIGAPCALPPTADPSMLFKVYYVAPKADMLSNSIGKTFGGHSSATFLPTDLLQVLHDLLAVVSENTIDIDLGKFCGATDSAGNMMCKSVHFVRDLGMVLQAMSAISGTFAWVGLRFYQGGGEVAVKDGTMRKDLEAAVNSAKTTIAKMSEWASKNAARFQKMMPFAPELFKVNVSEAVAWFDGATSALKSLCDMLYRDLHTSMLKVAKEVEDALPRVDHFISDETFNVGMIKKHILESPARKMIHEKTIALHAGIQCTSRLRTQWSIQDKAGTDMAEITSANATFNAARDIMTITAACKILFELTGNQQKHEATSFLAKKRPAVKASLISALERKRGAAADTT